MDILQETTFPPLGAAAPLKFLHALEIEQDLLTHTTMRTGSTPPLPPKKNMQKFKFWPKIQRVSPYNFGSRGIYVHQSLPGDVMNFGPQTKKL